jgi:hypothetical protein
MKTALLLQLSLERVEPFADKFRDLSTIQTIDMDVIPAQLAFLVVALAFQMHQVKFVNHSVTLQRLSVR